MILKVLWPYDEYDFGSGLPVITNTGTFVTDPQYTAIINILQNMTLKSRPTIVVSGGPGDVRPDELEVATHGWVADQLATIGAGGVIPVKHHQSSAAATWTIIHNRNNRPDVVLFTDDTGNERVYTDLTYPDDNTVVVEWPSALTGWAYVQ